jgi:hypothetical protein
VVTEDIFFLGGARKIRQSMEYCEVCSCPVQIIPWGCKPNSTAEKAVGQLVRRMKPQLGTPHLNWPIKAVNRIVNAYLNFGDGLTFVEPAIKISEILSEHHRN